MPFRRILLIREAVPRGLGSASDSRWEQTGKAEPFRTEGGRAALYGIATT